MLDTSTLPLLSVVVPCYNEREVLGIFADALAEVAETLSDSVNMELILVDDGSTDGTLACMKRLAACFDYPYEVRWLSFSRNFGKEAALLAGLEAARGEYVATMDADMQDPPSLLPAMLSMVRNDDECDSVATRRADRKGEPRLRSLFARLFYRIINAVSDADIVDGARDFRLMTRPMVDAVLSLSERNRFTKGIYGWVGFRTKWLAYDNTARAAGTTKWHFFKLFRYAIDGIVAFSTAPLVLASLLGILTCATALFLALFVIVRAVFFGDPVAGWPSLMTAILFVGGFQLLCLGIIGQYLAKTYLETKRRPVYVIRERSEGEDG